MARVLPCTYNNALEYVGFAPEQYPRAHWAVQNSSAVSYVDMLSVFDHLATQGERWFGSYFCYFEYEDDAYLWVMMRPTLTVDKKG